jgi:hypothetical protein
LGECLLFQIPTQISPRSGPSAFPLSNSWGETTSFYLLCDNGELPFLLCFMANLAWVWLLMISVSQMAQSAPTRTVWRTPSGNNEDFVTTYYIGSTLTIDWSGWDSSILNRDMNGTSKADLWVNAWNTDFSTWSKKISSM